MDPQKDVNLSQYEFPTTQMKPNNIYKCIEQNAQLLIKMFLLHISFKNYKILAIDLLVLL